MNDFQIALDKFVAHLHTAIAAEHESKGYTFGLPAYRVAMGKKNAKVITQNQPGTDTSVFCFVRIADGAVLKAAGWKGPAKGVRGTIYTDDPKQYGVTTYGAEYRR